MSQKFLSEVNLQALNNATTDTDKFLVSDSGTIKYRTGAEVLSDIGGQAALTNPVTGTGTTNYVAKFTGTSTVGNSQLFDNGTNVGIGTTSPNYPLQVTGAIVSKGGGTGGLDGTIGLGDTGTSLSGNGLLGEMYFKTANTEKMRITFGGNVGIGTTSPSEKLSISGNIELTTGSNRYIKIGSASNYHYNLQSVGDDFQILEAGTTPRLTIKYPSGNVGIGTASPSSRLHVYSSSEVSRIESSTTTLYQTFKANGTNVGYIGNGTGVVGGGSATDFGFQAENNFLFATSFGTERMRITSAGNVGIGTSSPGAKLDINGVLRNINPNDPLTGTINAKFLSYSANPYGLIIRGYSSGTHSIQCQRESSDSVLYPLSLQPNGGYVGIGTTSPAGKLSIVDGYYNTFFFDTSSQYGSGLILSGDAGGAQRSWRTFAKNGNGAVALTFEVSTNETSYGSSPTGLTYAERMRITSAGNVGIGTASPSAKFDINDSTSIQQNFSIANDRHISIYADAYQSIINSVKNVPLVFRTFDTERMRITSGGNVGIGTTSPSYKFDVNGETRLGKLVTTWSGSPINPSAVMYSESGYNTVFASNGQFSSSYLALMTTGNMAYMGGNVGIGTTSPGYRTQIETAAAAVLLTKNTSSTSFNRSYFYNNSDVGVQVNAYGSAYPYGTLWPGGANSADITCNAANGLSIGTSTASAFVFGTNSAERIRITSAGDVAVGTTAALLNTSGRGNITINGSSESILTLATGGTWRSYFFTTGGNTLLGAANEMTFGTNGGTERMRITSGGRIGIGTTTPYSILDAQDYTSFLSLSSSINSEATTPDQQIGGIDFRKHYSLAIGASIRQLQAGGTSNYSNAHLAFYTNNGSVAFGSPPPERMRLTENGYLGIGTDSPNALLDVAGDALIHGVTVGQGPVVGQGNTALGKGALGSMVGGKANIAVGSGSNSDNDATGLTTIGVELNTDPNLDPLNGNCLAIAQYNSNAYSNQVPHIYAPRPIAISGGTTDIISFDINHYAGAIVEYIIRLDDGGDYAMGTVYMAWKSSGSGNYRDARQIEWSNMSGFTFDTGGGPTLSLTNTSGNSAWVRITVRGMMTN